MKLITFSLLLVLVSCGSGGGSSSSGSSESIAEVTYKLKQTLNPIVTGQASIIIEAQCQVEHSCEVEGMIYGNDSGPLPMLKTNFTGALTWDGTHYSGTVTTQNSCAFAYEISLNQDQIILAYDGHTQTFNSLSSFTGDIAAQYSIVASAPQNCVDAR
jgi:hypothetical protein